MVNFFKKSQNHQIKEAHQLVYDFKRKYAFESYNPVSFIYFEQFCEETLNKMIEKRVNQLDKNVLDAANCDFLDNSLLLKAKQALNDLSMQRTSHYHLIRRLQTRWDSDYRDIVNILELRNEELDKLITEKALLEQQLKNLED